MDSITYKFTTFRPAIGGQNGLMNDPMIQRELARRAALVAQAAKKQDLNARYDVRPGRTRAHARVSVIHDARRQNATIQEAFRARGHRVKVDRLLLASLDAART